MLAYCRVVDNVGDLTNEEDEKPKRGHYIVQDVFESLIVSGESFTNGSDIRSSRDTVWDSSRALEIKEYGGGADCLARARLGACLF